jgi:hypothetical protein
MEGFVPRYGKICSQIWKVLYSDMEGFVPRYGKICSQIWKVLYHNTKIFSLSKPLLEK